MINIINKTQDIFKFKLLMVFCLVCFSFQSMAQDNDHFKISIEREENNLTALKIKRTSWKGSTIELRKGYEERALEKEVKLSSGFQRNITINDLEEDIYLILLKNSSGEVIEAESVIIQ